MKKFLVILLVSYVSSDKLDLRYLPPPGAKYSGGRPEDILTPLEFPKETYLTTLKPQTIGGGVTASDDFKPTLGINRGIPTQYPGSSAAPESNLAYNSNDQQTPRVPSTTISYAYTQTTTHPPFESFETTLSPLNSITDLSTTDVFNIPSQRPIQGFQGSITDKPNVPYLQSSLGSQQPPSQPDIANQFPTGIPNKSLTGQTLLNNRYPGQIQYQENFQTLDSGISGIPQSGYGNRNQGAVGTTFSGIPPTTFQGNSNKNLPNHQLPNGIIDTVLATGAPAESTFGPIILNKNYPGQTQNQQTSHFIHSGIPELPSQTSFVNNRNQSGVRPGPFSPPVYENVNNNIPGPTTGRPLELPQQSNQQPNAYRPENNAEYDLNKYQSGPAQKFYQTQQRPLDIGGVSGDRFSTSNLPATYSNFATSGETSPGQNVITQDNRLIPEPIGVQNIGSIAKTIRYYRPERPQAESDRNAVILNYENIITPEGFAYSFDTSNGIHADESGTATDGVKAKGSYSYIGDDGKNYTVTYTADENGFRPHGDHLPTPPPIPEAIKRVIEKVQREKETGIVDDGSYSEDKYGDNKYRKPQQSITKGQNGNADRPFNTPNQNAQYFETENNITRRPANQFNNMDVDESQPQTPYLSDAQRIINNYKDSSVTPSRRPATYADDNTRRFDNEDAFRNNQNNAFPKRPLTGSDADRLENSFDERMKNFIRPTNKQPINDPISQSVRDNGFVELFENNPQSSGGRLNVKNRDKIVKPSPNYDFTGSSPRYEIDTGVKDPIAINNYYSTKRRPYQPGLKVIENVSNIKPGESISEDRYNTNISPGLQNPEIHIDTSKSNYPTTPQSSSTVRPVSHITNYPDSNQQFLEPQKTERITESDGGNVNARPVYGTRIPSTLNPQSVIQQNKELNGHLKNNTGYQYIPPRNQFQYDEIKNQPITPGLTRKPTQQEGNVKYYGNTLKPFMTPLVSRVPTSTLRPNGEYKETSTINRRPTYPQSTQFEENKAGQFIPNEGRPAVDLVYGDENVSSTQPPIQSSSGSYYKPNQQQTGRPQFNKQYYTTPGYGQTVSSTYHPLDETERVNDGNTFSTKNPYDAEISTTPFPSRPTYYTVEDGRPIHVSKFNNNKFGYGSPTTSLPTQGTIIDESYSDDVNINKFKYPSTSGPLDSFTPTSAEFDQAGPFTGSIATDLVPGRITENSKYGSNLPSTTYRPNYTIVDKNRPAPTESVVLVDKFGRPIVNTNQQQYNQRLNPTNGNVQIQNQRIPQRPEDQSTFGGNNQVYNKPIDQFRPSTESIIGEDFSGPKQPQRFDPETGYYY